MSYKLLGRVERKVHIVRNERSAMVPQKSAYCEAWSSTPGVSLMMRKLRKHPKTQNDQKFKNTK